MIYESVVTEKGNQGVSGRSQELADKQALCMDANDCTNCSNCSNCSDCYDCRNCTYCTNCTNCGDLDNLDPEGFECYDVPPDWRDENVPQ